MAHSYFLHPCPTVRDIAIQCALAVVLASASLSAADPIIATPKPKPARKGIKWDVMDNGPFFSSGLAGPNKVLKSIAIQLGDGAYASFDTEMLRLAVGWTGAHIEQPTGRGGLEGVPQPGGPVVFNAPSGPGWAFEDAFKDGRPRFKDHAYGPLPRDHAKWGGLYLYGDKTILSYTVGSVSVLEFPSHQTTSGMPCFTRSFQFDGTGDRHLVRV